MSFITYIAGACWTPCVACRPVSRDDKLTVLYGYSIKLRALASQRVDGAHCIFTSLGQRHSKSRIIESRSIIDARSHLFGLNFDVERGHHTLKVGSHASDLRHPPTRGIAFTPLLDGNPPITAIVLVWVTRRL
jgi:hypothetical protein